MDTATFAAIAAAVISTANILVTTRSAGQREKLKWFREQLAQSYYEFIDASFRYRHEIGRKRKALADQAAPEEIALIDEALEAKRAALRDAQTKIRVLGPRKTLESAQALRDEMDRVAAALTSEMSAEDLEGQVERTRDLREEFISRAKRSLRLRS